MWTKIKFVGLFASVSVLALSGVVQADAVLDDDGKIIDHEHQHKEHVQLEAGGDKLFPEDLIPGTVGAWLGFGSDYNWRGVSQTMDSPSVQAELDYSVNITEATQFYVSVWASNVDYPAAFMNEAETLELDAWGGFRGEFPGVAGLTWDIGAWGYTWPGQNVPIDFVEVYAGLGYDFGVASVKGKIFYSPNTYNNPKGWGETSQYYTADVSIPLPKGLSLGLHVGRWEIDDNAWVGYPDYTDWKVGINVPFVWGLNVELAYIDTDVDETPAAGKVGCGLDCDERFYFFVSKTFGE